MWQTRHQQILSCDDLSKTETEAIQLNHIAKGQKFENDIYQLLLKTRLDDHLEPLTEFKKSTASMSDANKRDAQKRRIEKSNIVRELEINRRFGVIARGIDHAVILPSHTSMMFIQDKWLACELSVRYFNEFTDSIKKLYTHLSSKGGELSGYISEKCYAIYLSRKPFTTRAKEDIEKWNLEFGMRVHFISIYNENQTELMDDFKTVCHMCGLFYYEDDGNAEMVAELKSTIYSPPIA